MGLMKLYVKQGDEIRNKRSGNEFIVWARFWHIDCENDREGWMYHLKRRGNDQFKYVFQDKIDNYDFVVDEEELAEEQRKADEMEKIMHEHCKAHGGVAPFTPNIVGKLFAHLDD